MRGRDQHAEWPPLAVRAAVESGSTRGALHGDVVQGRNRQRTPRSGKPNGHRPVVMDARIAGDPPDLMNVSRGTGNDVSGTTETSAIPDPTTETLGGHEPHAGIELSEGPVGRRQRTQIVRRGIDFGEVSQLGVRAGDRVACGGLSVCRCDDPVMAVATTPMTARVHGRRTVRAYSWCRQDDCGQGEPLVILLRAHPVMGERAVRDHIAACHDHAVNGVEFRCCRSPKRVCPCFRCSRWSSARASGR